MEGKSKQGDVVDADSGVDISIIIISWNTREILRECLQHLASGVGKMSVETIVVDNGSTDGSQEMVRVDFPGVILIENDENQGFPKAVNQGIEAGRGKYLAILNSDTMVTPGSLQDLVEYMEDNPLAAAVGPQLMGKDGHYQYSGGFAPSLFAAFNELTVVNMIFRNKARKLFVRSRSPRAPIKLDWLCAACMIVRREAVDEAGAFDDSHFMYAEDMEYGLRLRSSGWEVHFLPTVKVVHYGGASSAGLKETKLLWLGGLFRVAAGRLSRPTYPVFGILLSLAYLERSILLRTVRAMPGLNNSGLAHAREAANYAKTAFKLGFHDPQYASAFCRKLEDDFRQAQKVR